MRKIVLSPHDLDMFAVNMTAHELEFIEKHWKPFRQMWMEQGRKFWIQFVTTYRMSATEYGVIKDLGNMGMNFQSLIDELFILIHENFIDGNISSAKKFIEDIIVLVVNKDKFRFLNTKSFAKDPFYSKETRDSFRHLFGSPKHKITYIKVWSLHELYTVFGGAIVTCLKRWLVAEELPAGAEESWPPIVSMDKQKLASRIQPPLCPYCHQVEDNSVPMTLRGGLETFVLEKMHGQPCGPWFVAGWKRHEDPRFHDPANPLYNLQSNPESDWREHLDFSMFLDFYEYVIEKYSQASSRDKNIILPAEFHEEEIKGVLEAVNEFTIKVAKETAGGKSEQYSAAHVGAKTEKKMKKGNKKKGEAKCSLASPDNISVQDSESILAVEDSTVQQQPVVEVSTNCAMSDDKPQIGMSDVVDGDSAKLRSSMSETGLGNDWIMQEVDEDRAGDMFAQLKKLRGFEEEQNVTEKSDEEGVGSTQAFTSSKWERKMCSHCQKLEMLPKIYKMCLKCKESRLRSARYYCSRECQKKDWMARHKLEHKHNLLK